MTLRRVRALLVAGALVIAASATSVVIEADAAPPSTPDFGPNVHIFKPSTDQAAIQAELNAIAVAQSTTSSVLGGTQCSSRLARTDPPRIRWFSRSGTTRASPG